MAHIKDLLEDVKKFQKSYNSAIINVESMISKLNDPTKQAQINKIVAKMKDAAQNQDLNQLSQMVEQASKLANDNGNK